jgi:PPOX class probable F420-dependent enzyme
MSHAMSPDEIRAFLSAGTRTAKLATVRADGRPHVAPVWYVLDEVDNEWGFDLILNTGAETIKGRTMRRDHRVMLAVDDERPPFAFVLVEGTVELSDDLDEMLPWAIRIGSRYMGADQGEAFGRRNAQPGELLVRLRPTHVIAAAGVTE